MEGWMLLWKWTFVIGSALFALMSVWVTVVGWSDVKALFAALAKSAAKGVPASRRRRTRRR